MQTEIKTILENSIQNLIDADYKLNDITKYLSEDENFEDKNSFESNFKELISQKEKLDWIFQKIKEDFVEVAFAGLEKAGKSTVINAFMEKKLLPAAPERTTFTITEVRYSHESKVEVEFYTDNDFINQIFKKMLEQIKFPDWDKIAFEDFTEKDINKHFKDLSENDKQTFQIHSGKTENDLKDIVKGKTEIKKLLNSAKKIFEEKIENYKDYITDKYKSRAVKRVTIYTDKLENLKNIIIYDLPGFDSPTVIHSKFTEDTLKKADAVIFVRKLAEPSIKGPELDIVNRVKEEDGIPIRKKTFFFLSQADMVDNENEIEEDRKKFIEDLREQQLFEDEARILVGSAIAHLDGTPPKSNFSNIKNEITNLKPKLEDFNKKERIPLLERRTKNIIQDSIKILEKEIEILEKNKKVTQYALGNNNSNYFSDNLKKTLIKMFRDLQAEIKSFLDKKELSEKIKDKIVSDLKGIEDIEESKIKELKNEASGGTSTGEERPDTYNTNLRDIISEKIEVGVIKSTYFVLDEETKNIYEKIMLKFKESIYENIHFLKGSDEGISKSDIESKEIKDAIDAFINKNYLFRSYEISALIMRFFGDIFELLIKNRINSSNRNNKLEKSKGEIYALWAFHENFDPQIPNYLNFVERAVLYQESPEDNSSNLKSLQESLKSLEGLNLKFSDVLALCQNYNPEPSLESLIEIVKIIEESKKKLGNSEKSKPCDEKQSKMPKFSIFGRSKPCDEKQSKNTLINTILNDKILNDKIESVFKSKKEEYQNKEKKPRTYKEVEEEIEKDLKCLKELIGASVIRAISPEKIFVNSTSIYMRSLKTKLDSDEYNEFIENIINFISIKTNNQNKMRQEMSKLIMIDKTLKEINETLDDLNQKLMVL